MAKRGKKKEIMPSFSPIQQSSPIIALPTFAPIPVPMVLHMLNMSQESFFTHIQHASEDLRQRLASLEERITVTRAYVYDLMAQTLASQPRISMKWLQDTIASEIEIKPLKRKESGKTSRNYSMSVRTMNNWRNNNVLLPSEPRKVNLDRAAALLITSIVDERKQGFVPSSIDPHEPEYWGYMQTAPEAPVLPCPFPPPASLPMGTLYWSRWPSFEGRIKQFPRHGSLGFVSLDQHTLELWDTMLLNPEIRHILDDTHIFGFGRKMRNDTLQELAESLYYRLAAVRLSPATPPPHLPLLWPQNTWSS